MITFYSFDLYGNLRATDTSEELVDVGQNLIRPVPIVRKGEFVEIEINDELWMGTAADVNHFPPNTDGDRVVHMFLHALAPKFQSSASTARKED